MLPTDVMKLVDHYNEDGVFIWHNGSIYWFNGKKFEYWIDDKCTNIFTYEHDLFKCDHGNLMIFKNNQFQTIEIPRRGLLAYLGDEHVDVAISEDGKIYQFFNHQLITDGEFVKEKPTKCGMTCIFYHNHIYCVSFSRNEKFNIESHEWSDFANMPIQGYDRIYYRKSSYAKTYYFNKKLYVNAVEKKLLLEYDFINDTWTKKHFCTNSKFNVKLL